MKNIKVGKLVTAPQLRKAKANMCQHWEDVEVDYHSEDLRDHIVRKNRYGCISITWRVGTNKYRTYLSAQIGRVTDFTPIERSEANTEVIGDGPDTKPANTLEDVLHSALGFGQDWYSEGR